MKGMEMDVRHLLLFVLILIVGRIVFFLIERFLLSKYYSRKGLDKGRKQGMTTLIKYLFYFALIMIALQASGFNITVAFAAGAALLVGVGIGLQQTFNDLISGVILLSEGAVSIGDWVEIQSTEGKVKKIGLRTSLIETRRGVVIIVPNSKLTVDNVVNITHNLSAIRYSVNVGVAYGTDVYRVMEILREAVKETKGIVDTPAPMIRFINFGDSSLDFEVLFWSFEYQMIENIKSDLRCIISDKFREHNIHIPFPQRDLHIIRNENDPMLEFTE